MRYKNLIIEDHTELFEVTEESVLATIEWLDTANKNWRIKYKELWNSRVLFEKV